MYKELGIQQGAQHPWGYAGVSQRAGLRIVTIEEVRIATAMFARASTEEWEEGTAQLAVRHIEVGSRTTYAWALRRFLEGSDDGKSLVEAVDARLQQLARRPRGDSAARGLLSAMRILEKLRLIPPTYLTRHWMQVEGIKRLSAPNVAPRVFAETGDLEFLGRHGPLELGEMFFLSTCAIVSVCGPETPKASLGAASGRGGCWNSSTRQSTKNGSCVAGCDQRVATAVV